MSWKDLAVGGLAVGGAFIAHKVLSKIVADKVLAKLIGSSGATTPPAAPAVSGLEMLQPYAGPIANVTVALGALYLSNKVVKSERTKVLITAGIVGSVAQGLIVSLLNKIVPQASGYLSGNDGTAARISAMYGFGAGASIQPHYAPIRGVGEYFAQNGVGEYFAQSGIGEYFAQNGLGNGLGSYGANPDLMQAAAGYGIVENQNSDHVHPGSDLDRQLSIAEAAAGVGSLPSYEAAAGMRGFGAVQPFEASAGFGAVTSVPATADTWIPGTTDGQIWAGVRPIDQGQAANELNSAGILETSGNQGVFG